MDSFLRSLLVAACACIQLVPSPATSQLKKRERTYHALHHAAAIRVDEQRKTVAGTVAMKLVSLKNLSVIDINAAEMAGLGMDSHNDVIRAGAAIALGSVRSVVAKRKLIALTGYGHSVKVRRAALESLADNWKPDDDVRLRLEQLTSDGMQDVRHKAIETLGTIANPRSRGVLHEVINKSLDIILRREARRAIVLRGQPAGS